MEAILKYRQFFVMIALWLIAAIFMGPFITVLIGISVVVLKITNKYSQMLAGFWFVLTLSDNELKIFHGFVYAKYMYLALLLVFFIIDFRKFRPFNGFFKRFIPFFIIAFFCCTRAPDSKELLISVAKTFSYLLMLILVPNLIIKSYKDDGPDVFKLFIYTAVFIFFVSLLMKIYFPQEATLGRFRGLFGNPNGLGLYSVMVFLLLTISSKMYPNLYSRKEIMFIYFFIFISLALSDSRNSILALFIFLSFSYFNKISPMLGILIMIILLGSYEYINLHIVSIVNTLGLQHFLRASTLANASGRYIAWAFAWLNIQKSIFLGHGFNYTDYLFTLNQDTLQELGHIGNAHNSFLTFWLDTGAIGLVLFIWAFVGKFILASKTSKIALALMYSILFSGFFESYLTGSENPDTIIIIILLTVLINEEFVFQKTEAVIPLH